MIGLNKKFTAMNLPVEIFAKLKTLQKAALACYERKFSYEELIDNMINGLETSDPELYKYYRLMQDAGVERGIVDNKMNGNMNEEMTLHEAIAQVLREAGHPLTVSEIASEVNAQKLYTRGDGLPVPSNQISARVKNYPGLFSVDRSVSPRTVALKR